MQSLPLVEVAGGVVAELVRACCNREGRGSEGERPREDEAQESQGRRTRRNSATVRPNRQRD